MLKAALTGGIATGKSYVRARIAAHGVPTIDADAVVHALLAPGTDTTADVVRRFGSGVAGRDGRVDRKALGALVFGDPAARRDLEAIVHPRVYARIADWMDEQAAAGARWVVADIPLLFETGRQGEFDRVVVVTCPVQDQVRRMMCRDGLGEAEALARLAAQWPTSEKRKRATDIVETDGTFQETDRQVDALCAALDQAAGKPHQP